MEHLRSNYPALQHFTYFNSCSSGLISNDLLNFRRQLDEGFQQNASNFRAGVYSKIREMKETVAGTFGAHADRTALIPSCSHGINLVLEALADEQTVMHLQNDYPSIIWPFESRNFKSVTVNHNNYAEAEIIKHLNETKADILAVSAVQYSNGEIITPQNFKAIKEQFPELLIIVDATQFFGTAPLDFDNSGIDLFVASTFKWLCAGYGNGVMFISKQLETLLQSKARGYNTFKNPKKEGQPTIAEYFEPGHQDLLAFQTLEFQVKQHAEIGFDNIQQQIKKVKTYAREKIANETNFKIKTSVNKHLASGILSVDAPRALVKHLNDNNIVCSYNTGLRLGIHFYNTFEDVDTLIHHINTFKN